MTERIAKFIASSGIASRRAAESLIEQGVVAVNGTVIDTPATMVDENDTVTVNGKDVVSIVLLNILGGEAAHCTVVAQIE